MRLVERNYYARIFSPGETIDPAHWMNKLGDDLRLPRFSLSHNEAMARRLRRNYVWLFLILLLAWLLKTTTSSLQPNGGQLQLIHSTSELFSNAAIGYVPGWLVVIVLLAFYGWLAYLIIKHREKPGEFFNVEYPIPAELINGKQRVTVRFQAHANNTAGGVFGAAIVRGEK